MPPNIYPHTLTLTLTLTLNPTSAERQGQLQIFTP